MAVILVLTSPFLAAGAVLLNLWAAHRGRERFRKVWRGIIRRAHRRTEVAELSEEPVKEERPARKDARFWVRKAFTTRSGLWATLASTAFLGVWVAGWVGTQYPLGFVWHFLGSWAAGILFATACFSVALSFASSVRFLGLRLLADRVGLSRIWIARSGKAGERFSQSIRQAFAEAPRIEILDFTGFELIAKGSVEDGGPIASLLARFPEKEARVLLFNPCAQEIDPDRKQTTVLESQLSALGITREAFESKVLATMNRIESLNRNRPKPIEVRLYSEKPCFRTIVAGDAALLGPIDPGDASGEFPLCELRVKKDGASLHGATRAYFLRAWGDSLPVEINAAPMAVPVPDGAEAGV
jgi:hypothetical protein